MKINLIRCSWLAACIIVSWGENASGQSQFLKTPLKVSISYESIPELVLEMNPEIRAATWSIREAESRMEQSGRLQNPKFITSYNNNENTPERTTGVGFLQAFPVTSRLRLEKSVSKNKIEEAKSEVQVAARTMIESALTTTVQWIGNQQRQSILKDQIRLATELATFLSEQSTKGEVSSLDAMQASLEAEERQLDLHPLIFEQKKLESKLRIALGLEPTTELQIREDLPDAKLPKAKTILLEKRPDYRLLQKQFITTQETIKLARANRFSDVSLQLMHLWNDEEDIPIGIEKERNAAIQLSIPLPLWNRNQGRISELNDRLKRLENSIQALEIKISNHSDAAYTGMVEQLAIYRQIKEQSLPKRLEYQKALETSYKEGLSSFDLMLRARHQILKLELARSKALTSFHIHLVQYQSETGNLSIFHESTQPHSTF